MAQTRVDFVKLPDGKNGLRLKTQLEDADTSCEVLGFWVSAVVDGRIKKVGEAPPEFCIPD